MRHSIQIKDDYITLESWGHDPECGCAQCVISINTIPVGCTVTEHEGRSILRWLDSICGKYAVDVRHV